MKPLWKRILSGAAAVLAACSLFAAPVSAGWVQSGAKWGYKNADGSYPKSSWSQITDKWYRFDSSGWMLTGWQKVGKSWYYLGTDGAMATGTATVDGKSYTFSASGVLEESAANHIVYWGETGKRYHIDPYCRSFHGKAAHFGSLETAKANGRESWCGICSKGWTDAYFEEVGNPNVK